jgi:hypothetical protein
MQFWKRAADTEFLRFSRVDAGNKRIDGVIQKFSTQAAADKIRYRFINLGITRRLKRLLEQPYFGGERKKND